MLGLLDARTVPIAGPNPDLPPTDEIVVANPLDGLLAERRAPRALAVVHHPPTSPALGEDGVGVVVHGGIVGIGCHGQERSPWVECWRNL